MSGVEEVLKDPPDKTEDEVETVNETKVEEIERKSCKHEYNWTLSLSPSCSAKGATSAQEKLATRRRSVTTFNPVTSQEGFEQGSFGRLSSWSHAYINPKSYTESEKTWSKCFASAVQPTTKSSMLLE